MKCRCNVCGNPTLIELPKEIEINQLILCPECDKQIAYGTEDVGGKKYWNVVDNSYDKEWGGIPVETVA